MKDILGVFITIIGMYVFQIGFDMLSPKTKQRYAEKISTKIEAVLSNKL